MEMWGDVSPVAELLSCPLCAGGWSVLGCGEAVRRQSAETSSACGCEHCWVLVGRVGRDARAAAH